jgi:hypothetical protein
MKILKNLDRRIIYLIIIVAIAIPVLKPLNLPIGTTPEVKSCYDKIDSLQPGQVVLVSFDFGVSGIAQIGPQAQIMLEHLFSKDGVKIIGVNFWPDGKIFMDEYFEQYGNQFNRVYGEDYVKLGYILGGETAMNRLGQNIHATFPQDSEDNNIGDLPMMQNVKSGDNLDLVIEFSTGNPGPAELVRQIIDPFELDYLVGMNSVSVVSNLPFYSAGQMDGYLNGSVGAAGYEALMNVRAEASTSQDPLSLSVIMVILFIIVGNIGYFTDKDRKVKGRSGK